jgi:hypothetical protein
MNKKFDDNLIPKKRFRSILTKTEQLELSAEEKMAMRERLVVFMKECALNATQIEKLSASDNHWSIRRYLSWPLLKLAPIIAVLIIILGGSSLSLVAEQSLPGDFLYPIKINVNERAKALISISPEAKANFTVWQTERRLQEAAKLAAQGRLDIAAKNDLENNLKNVTFEAKENLTKLSEEKSSRKPLELSSRLEATLKVHATVLSGLTPNQSNKQKATAVRSFKDKIEGEIGAINQIRSILEQKTKQELTTTDETEARRITEEKLKNAEAKIAELQKTITQAGTVITKAVKTKLQAALDAANESRLLFNQGNLSEAFLLSQKALGLATEAQLFVNTHKQLELDVGTAGVKISAEAEEYDKTEATPPLSTTTIQEQQKR